MIQKPDNLLIGINIDGAMIHDGEPERSPDERFNLLGRHFDYVEKSLHKGESLAPWLRASERADLPISVLGGVFMPGEDNLRAADIIHQAVQLDCHVVNCQIMPPASALTERHALEMIGELYLDLIEVGSKGDCLPSLEIHIDMWSERFVNVERLADWLEQRGAQLHLTIDHSHLLYRQGNQRELALAGLQYSNDNGWTELHPASEHALYREWLAKGRIIHAHARSVALNGADNPWSERSPGVAGRGVQYPFVAPPTNSYHQPWREKDLEPWKTAVRQLIAWKMSHPHAALKKISCEFIPFADYGGGARYSLIEQNIACAAWLRHEINIAEGG